MLIAAHLMRPAAVAAVMGHADWDETWKRSWPYFHPDSPVPSQPLWNRRVTRLIEEHEPIAHASELFPVPLLMIGGRDDHPV